MGLDGFAVFPAIAACLYVQYKGIVIFGNLIGKENSNDWTGWESVAFYVWIVIMVPFGWMVYVFLE